MLLLVGVAVGVAVTGAVVVDGAGKVELLLDDTAEMGPPLHTIVVTMGASSSSGFSFS